MISWTPLWSMIVESSLWEEPLHVRVLFLTMLSLKDRDHVVRWDNYKLAKKANITPEQYIDAVKVLQSPDLRRKGLECLDQQEFDGRRIQKCDEGWLILNGEKYKQLMQKMGRQEYQSEWQRNKRAEEKASAYLVGPSHPITGERLNDRGLRKGLPALDPNAVAKERRNGHKHKSDESNPNPSEAPDYLAGDPN